MSELQSYYDAFRQGQWATKDASKCLCRGSGWALSDVDTWHECPVHYHGQRHPEDLDYEVELDEVAQAGAEAFEDALAEAHLELNGAPLAPENDDCDLPF